MVAGSTINRNLALLTLLNHDLAKKNIIPALIGALPIDTPPEREEKKIPKQESTEKERLQKTTKKRLEQQAQASETHENSEIEPTTWLLKQTQIQLIKTLNYCSDKPELAPYYLARHM